MYFTCIILACQLLCMYNTCTVNGKRVDRKNVPSSQKKAKRSIFFTVHHLLGLNMEKTMRFSPAGWWVAGRGLRPPRRRHPHVGLPTSQLWTLPPPPQPTPAREASPPCVWKRHDHHHSPRDSPTTTPREV